MTSSNKPQAPGSGPQVRLIFFEQSIGCDTCAPTRRALRQIAESDDNVTLETLNLVLDKEKAAEYGIDRVPAVIVAAPGRDRIRYYGAPLGSEQPTLLEAIRRTATGETGLSEQTRARLKTLTAPVRLQVFFTPTCVYCPQMVALANQLAVESPLISTVAVDATQYPDLVRKYAISGVPKTVIDDSIEVMGAVTEDELVSAILGDGE
jgi:glutaredoxin-like protein